MQSVNDGFSFELPALLRVGERASELVAEIGLRIPKEHRLVRSVRLMRRHLAAGPTSDRAEFPLFVAAQQNVIEGYLIATVAQRTRDPAVLAKLPVILQGQISLEDDALSHVRDTQYELLLWALLSLANEGKVTMAEPDILITTRTGTIGVAAKRIGKAHRLFKHVKKAARQIDQSGAIMGVLAANVEQIGPSGSKAFSEFVASYPSQIERELSALTGTHLINGSFVMGSRMDLRGSGVPKLDYSLSVRFHSVAEAEQPMVRQSLATLGSRISVGLKDALRAAEA